MPAKERNAKGRKVRDSIGRQDGKEACWNAGCRFLSKGASVDPVGKGGRTGLMLLVGETGEDT